ncbi:MAG TPA: 2-phospho-L-lactate guanylyltransferase [Thermoleophilaceae bacterium]|nr:2-phospho-L-lactate guanylyltransferase [Thermoleophilaceae bacterium]
MRTLAILPVKSFGAAKQRLAQALAAGAREALAQAMVSDVLTSLRRTPGLNGIVVVTADRTAEAAALGGGVRVLRDTAQTGQSEAALIGIRHALDEGCERVMLVPGDTPLVQPGELAGLVSGGRGVVIVPDRHGTGTNVLVLSPPDAIEPSFGPGSFERHVAAAEAAGVPHRVDEVRTLALDVDTPADLAELAAELEVRRGQAPSTRGALRQLDRAGGGGARVAQAST